MLVGAGTAVLLAAVGPALAASLPSDIDHQKADSGAAATLDLGGQRIATFHGSGGGYAANERGGVVLKRLRTIMDKPYQEGDVTVATVHGEVTIQVKGQHVLTVCDADARAQNSTRQALAAEWADHLRAALRSMTHEQLLVALDKGGTKQHDEHQGQQANQGRPEDHHDDHAAPSRPGGNDHPVDHGPAAHDDHARPVDHGPAAHDDHGRPVDHGPAVHDNHGHDALVARYHDRRELHVAYRRYGNSLCFAARDPLAEIGAQIAWLEDDRVARIVYGDYTVICTVGSPNVIVIDHGRRHAEVWAQPATIVDGQLYLPTDCYANLGLAVNVEDGAVTIGGGFWFAL